MEIWRSRIENLEANAPYLLLDTYIHQLSFFGSFFLRCTGEIMITVLAGLYGVHTRA